MTKKLDCLSGHRKNEIAQPLIEGSPVPKYPTLSGIDSPPLDERMRLIANLIIDRILKDKENGTKKF